MNLYSKFEVRLNTVAFDISNDLTIEKLCSRIKTKLETSEWDQFK